MNKTQVMVWKHQPWRGKESEVAVQHLDCEYKLHNLVRDFHANGASFIFAGSMEEFENRLTMKLEESS